MIRFVELKDLNKVVTQINELAEIVKELRKDLETNLGHRKSEIEELSAGVGSLRKKLEMIELANPGIGF